MPSPGLHARRRLRRRAANPEVPTSTALLGERLLAIRPIDRLCERLLIHPRALQMVSLLIGVLLVMLTLRPLLWLPASHSTSLVRSATVPHSSVSSPDAPEQAVLDVVAAYNQASIAAAALGRADVMGPYLAPDELAWAQVQAEYQRRTTRGEQHTPTLTRWGILSVAVDGDRATVETQEQWDDTMSIGGQIVTSQRGILTRNTYVLRRASGPWQITHVSSIVVVG